MNSLGATRQITPPSLHELETVFDHAPIAMAFVRQGHFTRCNLALEKLLGFDQGSLAGLPVHTIFQTSADCAALLHDVGAFGTKADEDSRTLALVARDGAVRMCAVRVASSAAMAGEDASVWWIDAGGQDSRQAQHLLQTSRALQAVMDNAPVGILFTSDRKITRCNDKFRDMFGFVQRNPIGVAGRELYASDSDYAALGQMASPLLAAGQPFSHEMPMARQDGTVFWAHLIAYVLNAADAAQGTVWLISDRSRQKQQDEAIRNALFENQAILDNVVTGIVFLKNRVVQRCNPYAEQLFGFAPGTMVGSSTHDWYASADDYEALASEFYPTLSNTHTHTTELHFKRQDGSTFWGRVSGRVFDADNPLEGGSIWAIEDTSERHAAEAALRSATALTEAVFNSANVSIIATDTVGTIHLVNATAQRWLGYRPEELVHVATPAILHDPEEVVAHARALSRDMDTPMEPGFEVFVSRARRHGSDDREWTYVRKDGSRFPVHLSISALRNAAGEISGFIGIGVDITDRRRADAAILHAHEELEQRVLQRTAELEAANLQLKTEMDTRVTMEQEMRRMAHYDSLTGLPNRNLLNDRIEQAIEMARRKQHRVGMLFIDLDHFKTINDTLGHHIGDLLLAQVASRMSYMLRATDTLGRLGGDEFLFLAPEVDDPQKLAVIAAKFIEILAQPIAVQSHMLHVTPSIGVCCYPDHGSDRETLMRNADTAMYFAKSSGRNNFKFYTESLNADVDSRFQIENALRYAMGQNELSLHYQPLMDVRDNTVFGMEALLRWNSKTLGVLSPAQFIPIAEESGLIVSIGSWVLREGCMQVKRWREAHGRDYVLAVNLSPQQFRQPDLLNVVATILSETGFPPSALELEITESSLMHNVHEVIATLHQLVALGVRLAIDDFGTGYSSLSYLRHFPVHKLKIDQSFVRDIGVDERSLGIVSTIISLSATLGLEVIAEGVETQAQQRELMAQGCRFLQGYWFSRPLPVPEAGAFLAQDQRARITRGVG